MPLPLREHQQPELPDVTAERCREPPTGDEKAAPKSKSIEERIRDAENAYRLERATMSMRKSYWPPGHLPRSNPRNLAIGEIAERLRAPEVTARYLRHEQSLAAKLAASRTWCAVATNSTTRPAAFERCSTDDDLNTTSGSEHRIDNVGEAANVAVAGDSIENVNGHENENENENENEHEHENQRNPPTLKIATELVNETASSDANPEQLAKSEPSEPSEDTENNDTPGKDKKNETTKNKRNNDNHENHDTNKTETTEKKRNNEDHAHDNEKEEECENVHGNENENKTTCEHECDQDHELGHESKNENKSESSHTTKRPTKEPTNMMDGDDNHEISDKHERRTMIREEEVDGGDKSVGVVTFEERTSQSASCGGERQFVFCGYPVLLAMTVATSTLAVTIIGYLTSCTMVPRARLIPRTNSHRHSADSRPRYSKTRSAPPGDEGYTAGTGRGDGIATNRRLWDPGRFVRLGFP